MQTVGNGNTGLCNHGYFLADCTLCHKHQGECDYGSCEQQATVAIRQSAESRNACALHSPVMTGYQR